MVPGTRGEREDGAGVCHLTIELVLHGVLAQAAREALRAEAVCTRRTHAPILTRQRAHHHSETLAGKCVSGLSVFSNQGGVVALLTGVLTLTRPLTCPFADQRRDDHFEALPSRRVLGAKGQSLDS